VTSHYSSYPCPHVCSLGVAITLEFAFLRPLGYRTDTIGDQQRFTSADSYPRPFFMTGSSPDYNYDLSPIATWDGVGTIFGQGALLATVGWYETHYAPAHLVSNLPPCVLYGYDMHYSPTQPASFQIDDPRTGPRVNPYYYPTASSLYPGRGLTIHPVGQLGGLTLNLAVYGLAPTHPIAPVDQSIEGLMTAEVVAGYVKTPHHPGLVVGAMGAANIVCGFFGGIGGGSMIGLSTMACLNGGRYAY